MTPDQPTPTLEERASDITGWDTERAPTEAFDCAMKHLREVAADARRQGQEEMRAAAASFCRKNAAFWKQQAVEAASNGDDISAVKHQHRQKASEECEAAIRTLALNPSPAQEASGPGRQE